MTNRLETLDQYKSVCKLNQKEPNKLVVTILNGKSQNEPVYK